MSWDWRTRSRSRSSSSHPTRATCPSTSKYIRVIYYDVTDPFWGTELLDKVAENILSAIENPEEAVFKGEGD